MHRSHVLNVAVHWLALFLHILEIFNMNVGWETGCSDCLYGFFQSRQVLWECFEVCHDYSNLVSSQVTLHMHCIICAKILLSDQSCQYWTENIYSPWKLKIWCNPIIYYRPLCNLFSWCTHKTINKQTSKSTYSLLNTSRTRPRIAVAQSG
jgi:hypothetical protein